MKEEILETIQYEKFELLDFNRDVKKIKDLEKSMQMYGFLSPYPLHVVKNGNGKLRIKAGHHRFYVARKLGIPVKYVVSNDDISIYELEKATTPWQMDDYLDSHCRRGSPEYTRVREYCEWSGICLSMAVSMLGGDSAGSGNHNEKFKQGNFKINTSSTHAYVVAKIVLHLKGLGVEFYNATNLVRAISRAVRVNQFDTKRFMDKAGSFKALIEKKANLDQYMTMIEDIYNRSSQSKIPLKYMAEAEMTKRNLAGLKKR